jgi:hypothetical protein
VIGPVERDLRERLKQGAMSRDDVRRQLGPVALWQFDKLLRIGALELAGDGRWRLKVYRLDANEIAARKAAQDQARLNREQLLQQEAERWREQNRRRKAEEEQRALFEGLLGFTREERLLVVAERRAALEESRAHLAESTTSTQPPRMAAQGA